ncbi:MAG: hypothetical protein V2J26_02125 [Pacificimonas sp.]|nr:hypothetical protein [Pacificimonas sp.]
MVIDENELLAGVIHQGEITQWAGRPCQGFAFTAFDVFLVPFSFLWAGFAGMWNLLVWFADGGETPFAFGAFGLPFLIVGAYVSVGRLFHDRWLRKNTIYAVTNKRALAITKSVFGTKTKVVRLENASVSASISRNGRGTLTFGDAPAFDFTGFSYWLPSTGPGLKFFRVEEARALEELIARLQSR